MSGWMGGLGLAGVSDGGSRLSTFLFMQSNAAQMYHVAVTAAGITNRGWWLLGRNPTGKLSDPVSGSVGRGCHYLLIGSRRITPRRAEHPADARANTFAPTMTPRAVAEQRARTAHVLLMRASASDFV